jgi:hypothetical protein
MDDGIDQTTPLYLSGINIIPRSSAWKLGNSSMDITARNVTVTGSITGTTSVNYYVDSVHGNDANSGTSISSPIQTLTQLNSINPPSGSIIYLARGSNWNSSAMGVLNLNSTDNISVIAYGQGPAPIIDCSDAFTSGWTLTSGKTFTFQKTIVIPEGVDEQIGIWDNAATGSSQITHLSWQDAHSFNGATTISKVESTPGSFAYDGVNNILYVQTWAGTIPPATANSTQGIYSAMRDRGVWLGNNAFVQGIQTQRNLYNDGSLVVNRNSIVDGCFVYDGSKHSMLIGSGTVKNSTFIGQGVAGDYGGYSSIGFYFNGTGMDTVNIVNCIGAYGIAADGISYARTAGGSLLTAHADGGGGFSMITVSNCPSLRNYTNIFGNGALIQNFWNNVCYDVVYITEGGDTVNSQDNQFIMTEITNATPYIQPYQFLGVGILNSYNDTFIGSAQASTGFIYVTNSGNGTVINMVNATVITKVSANPGGSNFLIIFNNNMGGAINLSGTSYRTNIGGNQIIKVTPGVQPFTYTGDFNHVPPGTIWTIAGTDYTLSSMQQTLNQENNSTLIGNVDTNLVTTSTFNKTTDTTIAVIPGLSAYLLAGKKYWCEIHLFIYSDTVGGFKLGVNGTAVLDGNSRWQFTFLDNSSKLITNAGNPGGLNSNFNIAGTSDTDYYVTITGNVLVNSSGTYFPQFAQNSSSGTSRVWIGSHMKITQIV